MEVYEVLERALALIEREENWHQGGFVGPGGSRCAGEAVCHVMETDLGVSEGQFGDLGRSVLDVMNNALPSPQSVGHFNDTHTHTEVCDLFRRAIRAEKQKAGIYLDLPSPQPDEKTGDRKVVSV